MRIPTTLPQSVFFSTFNNRITKRSRLALALALLAIAATGAVASVSSSSFRALLFGRSSSRHLVVVESNASVTKNSVTPTAWAVPPLDTQLYKARRAHTATLLADGNVLIAGGENETGFVTEAEIFDPALGSVSITGNLGTPRADHTATRLSDGRVLLAGGRGGRGSLNSTEIFDPTSGAFTSGPNLNSARSGQSATVLGDGRIVFAGGDAAGSVEIYDPSANAFTSLPANMLAPRAFHSAALLNDGNILIVAGTAPDGSPVLSGEILDFTNASFTAVGNNAEDPHVRPLLRLLPDGKVQIIGGTDHEDMEIYDPDINQSGAHAHVYPIGDSHPELLQQIVDAPTRAAMFRLGASSPLLNRTGQTITELSGSNQALVTGGVDSNGAFLNSASVLNSSVATITTDKLDYAPGTPVIVGGTGWQPNEVVTLMFHEDPHVAAENPHTFSVQADGDGNFVNQQYAPEDKDQGLTYIVAAVGGTSGRTAQTAFTDTSPGSLGNYATAGLSGTSAPATVSPSNVATTVSFSTLSRGAGLTTVAASDAFNSASWQQTSTLIIAGNTDHYEFTITPNSGYKFSASEFRVGLQRSGSGPDKAELRSSLDSYGSTIGSVLTVGSGLATFTINLSSVSGLQNRTSAVTFRIYGYNASASGGTLRIQRVTSPAMVGLEVDGTVAALNSGTLEFSAANYPDTEATSGSHTRTITVQRTGGSDGAVSVHYATSDGTATTADNDYAATSGDLNWTDGDNADKTFTVTVKGDTTYEADETVNLILSSATGGATPGSPNAAVLTINNDDIAPVFSIDDVTQQEGNSSTASYVFTVTKTGSTALNATVNFQTQDGSATTADNDYQAASGSLTFLPADTTKTITVLVNGDTHIEPDENFTVQLSSPGNATLSNIFGTGTIQNDETSGIYTWVGPVGNTLWTNPLNWNPTRLIPTVGDILIFDGNIVSAPTVTGIPTETDKGLHFQNGVSATFNADTVIPGTKTLTISGAGGDLLISGSSSTLTLATTTALNLVVTSSATGTVGGHINFQDGAHRLIGTVAGAITFSSGSIFETKTGFTGNAFGDGSSPANGAATSIIFASGSVYRHNAGSSPFGAAANTVLTFQSGSEADYFTATGFDANSRTYATLVIGNGNTAVNVSDPCNISNTCTGNFQFDNLVINSTASANSSLSHTGTGSSTVTIQGNITSVGAGNGGTAPDLILSGGSGGIVINKPAGGTVTFGSSFNARAIDFESNATVDSATTLNLGRVVQTGLGADQILTVNGTLVPNYLAQPGYVVGNLRKNFDGSNLIRTFEVGTVTGFYNPVSVTFGAVSTPGALTATVKPGDISDVNNPVDTNKSVNANWKLTNGGVAFSNYGATFTYTPAQIDGAATSISFIVGKRDAVVWTQPTISGTPATTSITATGMTSMSDFAVGEAAATSTTTTAGNATATYGDNAVSLSATVSPDPGGGSVAFFVEGNSAGSGTIGAGGVATLNYNPGALGAGPHTIRGDFGGNGVYTASSSNPATNGTLTVNPATLSLTANDDSKTYGQTKTYGAGSPAFTSSGLQNGETIGSVTITASVGTAANAAVGSYNLTPSAATGGTFTASNYTITYNNGTLTVNPAALSITANNDSKTYGETRTYGAGSTAFTSSDLQNGEAIGSVTIAASGGTAATDPVGSYNLTPTAATGGTFTTSNYAISYHDGSLTVNARTLDITANDQSKTYGDVCTFAGTEFYSGAGQLVNGDTVACVTLTSAGAAAAATVTGSPYTITPSAATGTGLSNYAISYHDGSLTVNARTLDLIANNQSKTYGDAFIFAGSEFSTGAGQLVNPDTVASVTLTSAGAAATATGGSYAITPSAATGTGLSNYAISYHDGSLTVNARTLDITANNQSKTYGDVFTFAGTEFSSGPGQLVNGDTVNSVTLTSTGAAAAATVSTSLYTITPSAATGTGLSNYAISYNDGSLSISKRNATWTTNPNSKIYGTVDPAPITTGSGGNFVASDGVTATYSRASGETVAGSPYHTTATLSATLAGALGNYNITNVGANFTINKATLTVTAENQTRVYGAVNPSFTYTVTGFAFSDTQSVVSGSPTLSTTATTASPVGTYPITVKVSSMSAANYNFIPMNGTLSVTKGELTVTADNKFRSQGTPNPSLTATITGFLNGDTLSVVSGVPVLSTTATTASPSGTYPINVATGTLGATNYTFTFVAGALFVGHTWSGFLQPINSDGSSLFKLGSTVPVKFQLTGASATITNATNFTLWVAKVSNGIVGTEMEAVTSTPASTDNLFRPAGGGSYIYNMGTKGAPWSAGTYQLRADLGDGGMDRMVLISLKP